MLDIKTIREKRAELQKTLEQKNLSLDLDRLLTLDVKRTQLLSNSQELREKRNENIKNLKSKPSDELVEEGRELKQEIQLIEGELKEVETEFENLMLQVPMIPSSDAPIGKDDSDNVEVKRWNKEYGQDPKEFDFEIKDHIELGKSLDILDLERGVKTSGFRGYYLKNAGALMHLALTRYAIDMMIEEGFTFMIPPTLVKKEALIGSGHIPFDAGNTYVADSMLHLNNKNDEEAKFLVGTSEPSLLYYHAGETLDEKDLPIKLVGYSPCYRSEIGSYGRDTKGLYRIHEFLKIEQIVICQNTIEEATKWHQKMLSIAENLLQSLELPYRVIEVCTGDMGAGKYKMYDIETWMPGRKSFGETHSASNLLDWQARRLNLKIKTKEGKYYPYMLNNTVVASPRILIALWENYQKADGTIEVPERLIPYMGIDTIKN